MKIRIGIFLAFFALLAVPSARADDPGYFLSWKQKGQLIANGTIADSEGKVYDIWIVPGYVPPARFARDSFKRTGSDLGEYFKTEKYSQMVNESRQSYRWAFQDCLWDYALKGTPRAWGENFDAANERVCRRVFGWWLAYPWAFLESIVDNAVRIPAGIAGTALGFAWGTAGVPAVHLLDSGVKATWDFAVDTALVPISGFAWNTIVAPPLALAGQKPSPGRVDGFWVRYADKNSATPARVEGVSPYDRRYSPDEGNPSLSSAQLKGLYGLAKALARKTAPSRQRLNTAAAAFGAAQKEFAKEKASAEAEESAAIRELMRDPAWQDVLAELPSGYVVIPEDFMRTLRDTMSAQEARALKTSLERLLGMTSRLRGRSGPPPRAKTNPVTHGINESFQTLDQHP